MTRMATDKTGGSVSSSSVQSGVLPKHLPETVHPVSNSVFSVSSCSNGFRDERRTIDPL